MVRVDYSSVRLLRYKDNLGLPKFDNGKNKKKKKDVSDAYEI